jgi:nitroreductase
MKMLHQFNTLFKRIERRLIVAWGDQKFGRFFLVPVTAFSMRRELAAVMAGRAYNIRRLHQGELVSLRRNVHRLEKGIVMRPRRLGFGQAYLQEILGSIKRLDQAGELPNVDKTWAFDVLSEYFRINAPVNEPWFLEQRDAFETLARDYVNGAQYPFVRSTSPNVDIEFQQLATLATARRSVRWFQDRPVEPAAIDRALEIALQSPSACNRQSFRFHLIHGKERTQKILDTAGGTKGFSHQVPSVAVVIGRLDGYEYAFDRHAIYVDAGLASMSFLFGLEVQGLSSCCINWPDKGDQYRSLGKLIKLGKEEQVIMLIAIGHADPHGLVPASTKRGLDEVRIHS